MTQASSARVEKRLANKKKALHPTHSFAQMVNDATIKALQPFVQQEVAKSSMQVVQVLNRVILQERAMMQTRQLAFERLLKQHVPWFNEETLARAVAEVEDEAAGYKQVSEPAVEGDKLRVELSGQNESGEWDEPEKVVIHSLLTKNKDGVVQTLEAIENNMVGLKAGEEREFVIASPAAEGQEEKQHRARVKVMMVSRKEAKKNEQAANV